MNNINLLIKPSSSYCNMMCSYCFYKNESEIREIPSYGMMEESTLKAVVSSALNGCEKSCSFIFQGGEPTLVGLDFYKKLMSFQNEMNVNNVKIFNSIQTNGLLINEDWANFFKENDFLVGVSLDGHELVHDKYRKDCRGDGCFDRIMNGISSLEKYNVSFNILSVVTDKSAKYASEIYSFFRERGFKYIQFIPCLDQLDVTRGNNPYSLTPKNYASFLKETFDLWYTDCIANDGISIRNFDNYLLLLLGHPPENCGMNGRCSLNAVIESDGGVYPCDFYVLDEYRLGDIWSNTFEEMFNSDIALSFLQPSMTVDERCKRCKYGALCRGGCRRDRVKDNKGEINYFCTAFKMFFDYSLPRLREIASMKKHPYPFVMSE